MSIAGLRPQSPLHFALQPSARVSQTLCPPTSVTWLLLLRNVCLCVCVIFVFTGNGVFGIWTILGFLYGEKKFEKHWYKIYKRVLSSLAFSKQRMWHFEIISLMIYCPGIMSFAVSCMKMPFGMFIITWNFVPVYAMKAFGVKVSLHLLFTVAIDECEWSASRSVCFNLQKNTRYVLNGSLSVPQSRCGRR